LWWHPAMAKMAAARGANMEYRVFLFIGAFLIFIDFLTQGQSQL